MSEKRPPKSSEQQRLSARGKVIGLLGAITHKHFEEAALTVAPLEELGLGPFPLVRNKLSAHPTSLSHPRLVKHALVNRRDPDIFWGRGESVHSHIVIGDPMFVLPLGHDDRDLLYLTPQKSIAVAVPPFIGVENLNPVRLKRPNPRDQKQLDQWERDGEGHIMPIVRIDPGRSTLGAVATLEGATDLAQRLETLALGMGIISTPFPADN